MVTFLAPLVSSHSDDDERIDRPHFRGRETYNESHDQGSICPFALREVSVLPELPLGHLRYRLTDVPPQSNSPPGGYTCSWSTVLCPSMYQVVEFGVLSCEKCVFIMCLWQCDCPMSQRALFFLRENLSHYKLLNPHLDCRHGTCSLFKKVSMCHQAMYQCIIIINYEICYCWWWHDVYTLCLTQCALFAMR